MTSRHLAAFALYLAAFALVWIGTTMAPAHGWPVNDSQLNGCAALVLGMIAKVAGHVALAFGGER